MNNYYLAVPVGEPPKEEGWYSIMNNTMPLENCWWDREGGWQELEIEATHWLEPTSGVLLQTEELEDYKNKMECLLGYLEAWLINKPLPRELELVVKEADEFLASLTSKTEVK